jgi:hypothetical protein
MPQKSMPRLIDLTNELAAKGWPEGPKLRWVRAKFSKFSNRVIIGVVAGLVLGSLSSIIGLSLSSVDLTNATVFKMTVRVVALSAGVWAVVLACFVDFTYLYLRFLSHEQARWDSRHLAKDHKMLDGDMDSLLPTSARLGEVANPDSSGMSEP